MVEFYKVIAEYYALIVHEKSGETINFKAKVLQGDQQYLSIKYSHAYQPKKEAGVYYSDSYSTAESIESAEFLVKGWADQIAKSYAVETWSDTV